MRPLVLLCLLGFASPVLWAQDDAASSPSERTVVKVSFEGNRRYSDDVLREQIATKEGEKYDAGLLSRDRLSLRRFFSQVLEIREADVEGGVEITFVVLDSVMVGRVDVRGLRKVKKSDFEMLMSVVPGRPLLEHRLEADRKLLRRLHREKGYFFVGVDYYRRKTSRPEVEDVVFQVITSERVKVKEVILEGAVSVKPSDLKERIRNTDSYRTKLLGLGKFLNPKYYDRAAVDQDRRRMEVYYQQQGFRDARVVYIETRFNQAKTFAQLRFRIEEGKRYTLDGPIEVVYTKDGKPMAQDADFLAPLELQKLSLLQPGDPLRLTDLQKTVRAMRERLWERAYAGARITEHIQDNSANATSRIRLEIVAGPKHKVGRIRIYGNQYTKDNVIRRQFRKGALPGDFLNIEALEGARNRLGQLRYFDSIRFGSGRGWGLKKNLDGPDDVYDIDLTVREVDTRQFTVGGGVSTDGGAFGQLSITWRNFDIKKTPDPFYNIFGAAAFRGAGQRFTLTAAPGATLSQFTIAFSDPALRDSRWSLSTEFSRRFSLFDDYDQITDTALVRVGRFLDEDFIWNLSVNWSLRQVILEDLDPPAPLNAIDQQGSSTIHTLGVTLRRTIRREVDSFLNGHVTTLSGAISGGPLGGHVDIFKLSISHRAGWRVFRPRRGGWHRIQLSIRSDYATAFDDTGEVPIFERFFLGGRSLRGFEWREVGPRSNGRPTGGEFLLTLSLQYTIPITTSEASGFGLDFVVFLDQGGLDTTIGDFDGDDWRVSAGFGFAIGFGGPTQPPLIIDFGFPIRDQAGDVKQVVSIAFQRNF